MSIEPVYRIEFAPEVRDFIRRLVKQDRAAVFQANACFRIHCRYAVAQASRFSIAPPPRSGEHIS